MPQHTCGESGTALWVSPSTFTWAPACVIWLACVRVKRLFRGATPQPQDLEAEFDSGVVYMEFRACCLGTGVSCGMASGDRRRR